MKANIFAAVNGLGMESDSFTLVLAGGNLVHDNSMLAALLTKKVNQQLPKVTVVRPSVNAAVAAGLLIRQRLLPKK